jgi:hypothetical protein
MATWIVPGSRTTLVGIALMVLLALPAAIAAQSGAGPTYVGSEACRDCHEDEYASYRSFAKKAHSFDSISKMRPHLTAAEFRSCLPCHTTGYGQPGGFRSERETPGLMNAGCEVCHGPGSIHVATTDAADIKGQLSRADCSGCHNEARVEAFGFKPMIFGGGH